MVNYIFLLNCIKNAKQIQRKARHKIMEIIIFVERHYKKSKYKILWAFSC